MTPVTIPVPGDGGHAPRVSAVTAANQSPSMSLKRAEAEARFELLDVASYDVRLDLAGDEATFRSVTTVRFTSRGGATFVDLKPLRVNEIRFNGAPLDADLLERGRLPLTTVEGDNELVVDAVMRFRNDGEGLHRSVDPADGRHYVYGMSFMDAAPSIFACFDQPDLKAPYTFHVTAPTDWVVVGNAPGSNPEPGVWELEQTQPLSTYFVTLVAGPYHVLRDEHDGIALGLSARQSIAKDLDADAEELFTMTRQCFDEYHRLFGIRYPFGDYHQAFVPEFNAGAMENPGCVTFRDPLVFSSRVTRGVRIQRASTLAHEMAHQWFGNLTTPKWWDDLWLNESFAEYMGNRVTGDVTEYDDVWTHNSYARRQWGLVADQRPSTHPVAGNGAADASAALQDFDGISYAKGSSILKQLNARLGDEVFFAGVVDHFTTHRFGNATMHDLFASWERAAAQRDSAVDLSSFTSNWLRTAGPDAIVLDRAAGVVRRTPPADHPAERSHTVRGRHRTPGGQVGGRHADPRERRDAAGGRRRRGRGARPVRGHLGRGAARPRHGGGAGVAAARDRGPRAARRHLEQRAQRLPQRRRGPGRRRGPAGGRAADRGHRRRGLPHAAVGPARGRPDDRGPRGRPRPAAHGAGREGHPGPRRLDPPARGLPVRGEHRDRRRPAALLAGRPGAARRRRGRPRPALADAGAARDAR